MDLLEAYMRENLRLELEYAEISLTAIDMTEPALRRYYDDHSDEFLALEIPVVDYVVFGASPTLEDELLIEEEAKDLFALAQEGVPLDTLAEEYRHILQDADSVVESLVGPVRRDDGYHIFKKDKELWIRIRPSGNTLARAEEEAGNFAQAARSGFKEAAVNHGLEVLETSVPDKSSVLQGINLSYIDLETEGKLIGPVEAPDCFYVLFTQGKKKARASSDFDSVKDEVSKKYLLSAAEALGHELIQKVTTDKDLKQSLAESGLTLESREFSGNDSSWALDLFLKASNIPEQGTAVVSAQDKVYLVRCLKRHEPQEEDAKEKLPEFNARWMKRETQKMYAEWLNNLKEQARVEDFRYKVY
jgi:hypothetical protein